jgi:hypothetical protein
MSPRVPKNRCSDRYGADAGGNVTLRVIDSRTPSALPVVEGRWVLYLVPLPGTRNPSSRARRLRLRDSLIDGEAGRNAVILARDPFFWEYLQQINPMAYDQEIDGRRARHFINRVCGISGRHELGRDALCAQRFFSIIEEPFLEWLLAGD